MKQLPTVSLKESTEHELFFYWFTTYFLKLIDSIFLLLSEGPLQWFQNIAAVD